MSDLSGSTTIIVGASRGLGRGIAQAVAEADAHVVAVARTESADRDLPTGSRNVTNEIADAGEPGVPRRLLQRHDPDAVVVVAGAVPTMKPLNEQTWESFSVNWHADVRIAFEWLREILVAPLRPGGRVIVVSSGAALAGSPLSGGYAGAKVTQRFITGYAQDEANRRGLQLTFTTVLPRFAPMTGVGAPAVDAYAAQAGKPVDEFLQQMGPPVTPWIAGTSVVGLLQAPADTFAPAYVLTGNGLKQAP